MRRLHLEIRGRRDPQAAPQMQARFPHRLHRSVA
ncbi:hypothetical protein LINPERPRIM_LOCUS12905 [Linum perenne]